jgi:isoleucyl-tRNA synthetase
MIENRPDWCISRQRAWGVPIALFVNKKTGHILGTNPQEADVFNRICEIFEKEGSDAWWARPASDFLGTGYNPDDYEQIFDIVDVWFESGATHAFVIGDKKQWPEFEGVDRADLYLEGSDQHRGWFHSSLLESSGTRGRAPYKTVLTHGFVLDDKGYKMSKSLGNVVDPLEIMQEHGADILRLWTMTSDYAEDIRIGKDTLKNTGDIYRRIRNTLRFLLGALDGFTKDEAVDLGNIKALPELEQLMLHKLYETDQKVRGYIADFEFMKLTKLLHDFCNEDLSAFYFDIRKDRLYCDRPDSFERRATRTVMAEIFNALTAWLAPILAFTAEEAWSFRPKAAFENIDSVHLRTFPEIPANWRNDELFAEWNTIKMFRSYVLGALEEKRKNNIIKSSLEAFVHIYLTDDYYDIVKASDMAEVCILSNNINLTKVSDFSDIPEEFLVGTLKVVPVGVSVTTATGSKCDRCWKVLPEVGSNTEHTTLCNRCADAVSHQKRAAA